MNLRKAAMDSEKASAVKNPPIFTCYEEIRLAGRLDRTSRIAREVEEIANITKSAM